MLVHFHAPCFDGIVSAVLAAHWFRLEYSRSDVWFREVNYNLKDEWLQNALPPDSAVVDFLYHPSADWWADHHATTFLTPAAEADYLERRSSHFLEYDAQAPSCASVLWKKSGDQGKPLRELVDWAEVIDAARYHSAEQAIFAREPALRLNAALESAAYPGFATQLVQRLLDRALGEVAQDPLVLNLAKRYDDLTERGMNRFRELIVRNDPAGAELVRLEPPGIVVFDLTETEDLAFPRYAPFFFFPEAAYSAGLTRTSHSADLTTMRNPWRDFPCVHLGTLCERWGGGGHSRVGSIHVSAERLADASARLAGLVEEIRRAGLFPGGDS